MPNHAVAKPTACERPALRARRHTRARNPPVSPDLCPPTQFWSRLHFESEEGLHLQHAPGAATAAAAVFSRYTRENAANYPHSAPPARNAQV